MADSDKWGHIKDQISRAEHKTVITGFLDEAGIAEYTARLSGNRYVKYILLGGYPEAQRAMLVIFPSEQEDYLDKDQLKELVSTVRIENRSGSSLDHRDYLGAIMALGIKRELMGDIITDKNGAYVFCAPRMAQLLVDELCKVGSVGVSVSLADGASVAPKPPELMVKNVSSLRLDCLVAAVLNKNREHVKTLIEGGLVRLCGSECKKPSRELSEGDTFSVKGKGKYKMGSCRGTSAKNRIFVEIYKFL